MQVSWLSSRLVWAKSSNLVAFSEHLMVVNALYTMMSTSIHLGFKVGKRGAWRMAHGGACRMAQGSGLRVRYKV